PKSCTEITFSSLGYACFTFCFFHVVLAATGVDIRIGELSELSTTIFIFFNLVDILNNGACRGYSKSESPVFFFLFFITEF
ncbi:LOW QUALITY PROTEIN: hypothetical protein TorRG33x02_159680, partial [Trema orientale]